MSAVVVKLLLGTIAFVAGLVVIIGGDGDVVLGVLGVALGTALAGGAVKTLLTRT